MVEMLELRESVNLNGYTLIFPSVSVGNVGQLATDLLIYNLQLTKLGYLYHESIIPLIGKDPFGRSPGICTASEIYHSAQRKLLVIQNRSAFSRKKVDFIEKLCHWCVEVGIIQVVILTGSSAHERRDKQLVGEPLRYVFNNLMKEECENAVARNWTQLEQKFQDTTNVYIPGGGIAVPLFEECSKTNMKCAVLIEFCSDGNNIPDAIKLTNYVDSWLKLKPVSQNWDFPPSWTLLFGPDAPVQVFN